jgi:hypothetical protein
VVGPVALTLLVRDDDDVLDANLRHHLELGVDVVLAVDHASSDGSREILEAYRRDGIVAFTREEGAVLRSGAWRTALARRALAEHGAAWVVNPDPDELLWPLGGSLPAVLADVPPGVDAVRLSRPDFLPARTDDGFFADRMLVREAIGHDLQKVAFRPRADLVVEQGATGVSAPSGLVVAPYCVGRLMHFRHRGPRPFAKSLAAQLTTRWLSDDGPLVAEKAQKYLGRRTDITIDEVREAWRDGALEELYPRLVHLEDDASVAEGLRSGRLVVDPRIRDRLDGAAPTAEHAALDRRDRLEIQAEAADRPARLAATAQRRRQRAELRAERAEQRLEQLERSRAVRLGRRMTAVARAPRRSRARGA